MSLELLDAVPLTSLSGEGAAISNKLAKIGIHNLQDLLFHLPIRYEDRTRITPIANLRPEQYFTIENVQTCEVAFGRRPNFIGKFVPKRHIENYVTFFNFNCEMGHCFHKIGC